MRKKSKPYNLNKIFTLEGFYKCLPEAAYPINKIPNLQEALTHYKTLIQEGFESRKTYHYPTDQIYTHDFVFPDNQYYKISWNIGKAKDLIKKHGVPIVKLELDEIADSIFKKNLTLSHVDKARRNNDPIIVAHYGPSQSYVVIDGNHRAYAKLQDKKKTIDAYILPPEIHSHAMCSSLDYTLCMFHHNVNCFLSYICGEMEYETLLKSMFRL